MPRRLIALACLISATPAAAEALRDSVPHITVTGEASAEVVPDQADIRLGVGNERPTADAAAAATAAQATAVVEAIKAQGIAAADIRSNFSLAAEYDNATDPRNHVDHRTLRGYSARTQITVRLHDVTKAGALARMLIEKGANSFEGIDYSSSKLREMGRQLSSEAAKNAEAAAHATSDALNLRLGRVLQIDADTPAQPIHHNFSGPARLSAVMPMEPGTQVVTRNVTVTFEVESKPR